MVVRVIIGLGLTMVAFGMAGRRLWWLKRLALSGQPAPERLEYARANLARDLKTQLTEVLGQRKLLKWSVPGAAHAATFWGFIALLLTIIDFEEADPPTPSGLEDRRPDLEGHAGPGHLHRVRPLPVAVPCPGERQAAESAFPSVATVMLTGRTDSDR